MLDDENCKNCILGWNLDKGSCELNVNDNCLIWKRNSNTCEVYKKVPYFVFQ